MSRRHSDLLTCFNQDASAILLLVLVWLGWVGLGLGLGFVEVLPKMSFGKKKIIFWKNGASLKSSEYFSEILCFFYPSYL